MSKQSNIPTLRFPEFSGEWKEKKLGDVASNIMYGIGAAATTFDGKNKYLRITDIDEDFRTFIPNPLTSPEGNIDNKYYLKENDIVFARTGASVGKSYLYNPKDGILIFAGFLIKINVSGENAIFVFQQTLRNNYKKWVVAMSMRSGQPGLNAEEYKSLKFYYPQLPEQQKIATFLTAVDSKIELLQKKKQGLEQYKKGVMQQLFTQQLRFKKEDGTNYPDWEEKRLGEICDVRSSKRVLQQDWKDEGVPFYRTREIISLSKGETFKTPIFISDELFQQIKDKYDVPEGGDMLVTGVGSIGETYKVKLTDKFYFKDGNVLWFKLSTKVVTDFLFQSFKTRYVKKQLSDNATITTVATFTIDGAKKTLIKLPCLEEQTKIANFLSAIDTKIALVNTQLENTQQFKKGLLQQMFV